MLYINQKKYPHMLYITQTELTGVAYEKGQRTTISDSSCGLCSAVMVADRLCVEPAFDLEAAIQLSYQIHSNNKSGTSYKRFAPAFAEKFHLTLEMTNDIGRLDYCLRTGGAAVAHVGGDREGHIGVFSHNGHYITVISVEPDGRFAVLDPSYVENKYDEEGRQGKVEMKNGVIALCDGDVLVEDTANRNPSFYLFWRK